MKKHNACIYSLILVFGIASTCIAEDQVRSVPKEVANQPKDKQTRTKESAPKETVRAEPKQTKTKESAPKETVRAAPKAKNNDSSRVDTSTPTARGSFKQGEALQQLKEIEKKKQWPNQ